MDTLITQIDSLTIAQPGVRIDTNSASDFQNDLMKQVTDGKTTLLIDFSMTEYISSAGLRVLLIIAKIILKGGGKFGLCEMKKSVQNVFEMAGFYKIFTIYKTRDEGIQALTSL